MDQSDLIRATKDFTAGWIGGMAQVLSGQPFDTIKVRLQTQLTPEGPLECLKRTVKTEGLGGLYRVGVGLCVSVQFVTYEGVKRHFRETDNSTLLTTPQLFLAGALSGTANSVIAGPIEHIRIRLQIQDQAKKTFKGPLCVTKHLLGNYGIKGLFHGQFITTVREFQGKFFAEIGYGFYFMVYEYLAQSARHSSPNNSLAPHQVILFGALAGYGFWLPSFPIDVIKSKLQADSLANPRYKGIWDCAKQTFRDGGIRAFYKGFTPCLLRAAPVNAATFVAYEWASKALNSK